MLEIQQLHRDDFNLACGEDFDPVYLAIAPDEGSKPPGEATRLIEELERRRAERYEVPLGAGSDRYAAIAVVDGCLLRRALRVPGLLIFPIAHPRMGGDVYALLQAVTQSAGLPFPDVRATWMASQVHSHPIVGVLAQDIRANDPGTASGLFGDALTRALALMALNRGATPRPLASLLFDRDDAGWHPLSVGSYDPVYGGNLLGGFLSGESPHGLLAQWAALDTNPRAAFWLGQANGIRSELQWDARVFRYVALLEAIAREVHPRPTAPRSSDGQRLLRWDGSPASPGEARAQVYSVVSRAARAVSVNLQPQVGGDLWTAAGLWVDVRNAVAHQGGWPRVAALEPHQPRTQRVQASLAAAQSPNDVHGVGALLMDIDHATHQVLTAAVRGHLD